MFSEASGLAVAIPSLVPQVSSFSGFGSRKEEEMYDQLVYNTMRLLGSRLKKMFSEVLEGNHNPYTRDQANDDARLKSTIEKHYQKLKKME